MRLDWLESADWLDARRLRGYLWLLALLNGASLALMLATSHGGVDFNGFLLGSDFLSFWSAGKLLLAGGIPYDVAAHVAEARHYLCNYLGIEKPQLAVDFDIAVITGRPISNKLIGPEKAAEAGPKGTARRQTLGFVDHDARQAAFTFKQGL